VSGQKSFRDLLAPHCGAETLDRLVRYAELLEKWSRCHNLVRYTGREELVTRHLLDSLVAAPLMGSHGRLIDVGSGAGLPGVPLLAACPGFSGVLLEPREKRWAFLKLVIRELGLDARAERARYHDLENGRLWDAVTVRAVGKQPEILGWARSRLARASSRQATGNSRLGAVAAGRKWDGLSVDYPEGRGRASRSD